MATTHSSSVSSSLISPSSSSVKNAPLGPLPFYKQFIAGGLAGILEILVMYPIDTIKTRHQLSTTSNLSMIGTLRTIVAEEGIGRLYRGILSPIFAEAPKRAVKFSTNEQYKKLLSNDGGVLTGPRAFLAGALAGSTEMLVNCPFEVIKVRMQAKGSNYSSTIHCAASLIKNEGFVGLYKGGEPMLWRNALWNGMYFGLIGTFRNIYPTPSDASKQSKLFHDFSAGCLAGGVGTLLNTPFDVAKSRMQNQVPVAGQPLKYQWSIPSMMTIAREEGLASLWKGLIPRMVRLGPGGGIMLVAFDRISEYLRHL